MEKKRTGRIQHCAARVWVPLHPPCPTPSLYLPQHLSCQIHLFSSPKPRAYFVLGLSPVLFCFPPLPHFITPSFITLNHYCTCTHRLCLEVRGRHLSFSLYSHKAMSLFHFLFLGWLAYLVHMRRDHSALDMPNNSKKPRSFSSAPITSSYCLKSPTFLIFPSQGLSTVSQKSSCEGHSSYTKAWNWSCEGIHKAYTF